MTAPQFQQQSADNRRRVGMWMVGAAAVAGFSNTTSFGLLRRTACEEEFVNDDIDRQEKKKKTATFFETTAASIMANPFPEDALQYDSYNGVTLFPDDFPEKSFLKSNEGFAAALSVALTIWKTEGRKGIWVHISPSMAHLVPHCIERGFSFHSVRHDDENNADKTDNNTLIMSLWLPDSPSRLPLGPLYQVGVGTVVLHPEDPSLMLVVQEKTGPAAARQLWKMPTGLVDPNEDIPDGARRELLEETGLHGEFRRLLCFRQAHRAKASDLFFVCWMKLTTQKNHEWNPQQEEIADIQWMKLEDYANQPTWQGSPVYQEMNNAIIQAIKSSLEGGDSCCSGMAHQTLPVGFQPGTNALFHNSRM